MIGQLTQDHTMIGHLVGGLQRALDGGGTTAEKFRHLDGIEAVTESHFRYEERRLLDVLDAIEDGSLSATALFGPLG